MELLTQTLGFSRFVLPHFAQLLGLFHTSWSLPACVDIEQWLWSDKLCIVSTWTRVCYNYGRVSCFEGKGGDDHNYKKSDWIEVTLKHFKLFLSLSLDLCHYKDTWLVLEDKTWFSVLSQEQCSSRSSAAAAWYRNNSNNGRAAIRTKSRKGTRTCSENSGKMHFSWQDETKSPHHFPGFIYKEFQVFKGTNSTSVGAKFWLCLAAIILSSCSPPEHILPGMRGLIQLPPCITHSTRSNTRFTLEMQL